LSQGVKETSLIEQKRRGKRGRKVETKPLRLKYRRGVLLKGEKLRGRRQKKKTRKDGYNPANGGGIWAHRREKTGARSLVKKGKGTQVIGRSPRGVVDVGGKKGVAQTW